MNTSVSQKDDQRQATIDRLKLDGFQNEDALNLVCEMACQEIRVPISLVTLLRGNRQLFLGRFGLELAETPREWAFCNHAVDHDTPLIVGDVTKDHRFADNPLVRGAPFIRAYAGIPLEIEDGVTIGTLCIIDTNTRAFRPETLARLKRFANQALGLLQNHAKHWQIRTLNDRTTALDNALLESTKTISRHRRLLDDAAELADLGAFETDLATGKMTWSQSMFRLHEVSPDFEPDQSKISSFYDRRDVTRYRTLMEAAQETGEPVNFEAPITTAKGRRRWMRVRVNSEYDANGVEVRRYGMKQDITEQRRALNRARYLAERDPLTGLRNRKFFRNSADTFLKKELARGRSCFVVVVDLDGFKLINDTHGHGAGDICLKETARRLTRMVARQGIITRFGGDEFVLLLSTADMASGRKLIAALPKCLTPPVLHEGKEHKVHASLGIAIATAGADAMELMRQADLAMYEAKSRPGAAIVWFDTAMRDDAIARDKLLSSARLALANSDFELFYQPKICLTTGELDGVEALLRWRQPDGSHLAPGAFLPVMTDHALSAAIGNRVIDVAIQQAATWRKHGVLFGHIAINMAPSQFIEGSLAKDILAKLADAGVPPDVLQIEITEDVLLGREAAKVHGILDEMRAGGLSIALDDFGTGFASLIHLRDLPIDTIKVDQSFIRGMTTSETDMVIVQTIALLAERLNKKLVAEGVETAYEMNLLRAYGCHAGQGYYFARPMPGDQISWSNYFEDTLLACGAREIKSASM